MDVRKYLPCERPSEATDEMNESKSDNEESICDNSDANMADNELSRTVPNPQPSDLQCSTKAAKQWSPSPGLHIDGNGSLSTLGFTATMQRKVYSVACVKSMKKKAANAHGGWTSQGVTDWNHANELLKLHNDSKWHKDAVVVV